MRNQESDSKLKELLSKIFSYIIGLYLLLSFIFIPYFNYVFIRENSFATWILLGEVVPTVKGFLWPYFLLANTPSTDNDPSVDNFYKALESSQNATKIINSGGSPTRISEADMTSIINYQKEALGFAEHVQTEELDKLYPELGKHFKDEFIDGLSKSLEGYSTADAFTTYQGQTLKNSWDDWYIENKSSIAESLN